MKGDEKSTLRVSIRRQLQDLSCEDRLSNSQQICNHLLDSEYFSSADPTLTFAALPDEPDLLSLFEQRKSQQPFCFPRVTGSQLEIYHVTDAANLTPGYANILEPSPEKSSLFPAGDLRIILLPGLAFDPHTGGRLGKGKGFYDRLINDLRNTHPQPLTIGICFHWQLTRVPLETHDQEVDLIVTENGIIDPHKDN